jgi:DNA modification methylase
MKVPFTQQFTPKVTPLNRLLPILRANAGKPRELKKALASAFFKESPDPAKMAGNTLISLRYLKILDEGDKLTDFGKQWVDSQGKDDESHKLLARHLLLNFDGIGIVQTLSEMASGGIGIKLTTLPAELEQRGFVEVKNNSSDLSGVFGWLRKAGVLNGYTIDPANYYSLIGTSAQTLEALKDLDSEQIAFLKAMAALNVREWTPYNLIIKHAEELYSGEIRYNPKMIVNEILKPLESKGFIEVRKKEKKDKQTRPGRGGKPTDVRPTGKFEKEVADPLINALYRAAGFTKIREIRSKSLVDVIADIKQKGDPNKQGRGLEILAIRLCQMLDLQFMGWRETDVEIAGGGEVDAMLYSSRLIYSRWQIQCKVGKISLEAVAKEVGMQPVTLSNVILIVSTGPATAGATTYRQKIINTSNLNIIFIDGSSLERIISDNSELIEILQQQAQYAMSEKPKVIGLKEVAPTEDDENGDSGNDGNGGQGGGSTSAEIQRLPSGPASANEDKTPKLFSPDYATPSGRMYCGDALEVLPSLIQQGFRAKLIMTSPPFALVRKKEYGNEDSDSYLQWFERFIPYFKQILEPTGSLVIDIGSAWIKGLPAKSIYQYKLLVKLCESGFYLAQEFYHFNPAKLPTPAEWVTVRRMRVKDAMNNVWWLTLDPFADADNRRVLIEYSDSMKTLLKRGYKPALRPSGHDISNKFQRDNGGAIPPNLLQFSNTESNSFYIRRCKEEGFKPHPARFPQPLPEFFIKFLTVPGEVVIDPFAGSNVTGAAAQKLDRQWIGIELNPEYVRASKLRFEVTNSLHALSAKGASASVVPADAPFQLIP